MKKAFNYFPFFIFWAGAKKKWDWKTSQNQQQMREKNIFFLLNFPDE